MRVRAAIPRRAPPFLRAAASSQHQAIIAKQLKSPVARTSDFFPKKKPDINFFICEMPVLKHWKLENFRTTMPVNYNVSAGGSTAV